MHKWYKIKILEKDNTFYIYFLNFAQDIDFFIFYCRYHFFLQLKKDLVEGRLVCPHSTSALLSSYAIQCEYYWSYLCLWHNLKVNILLNFNQRHFSLLLQATIWYTARSCSKQFFSVVYKESKVDYFEQNFSLKFFFILNNIFIS